MNLNEFLINQKTDIKNQFINNMSKCLVATTLEEIKMHAVKYKWNLYSVNNTNKNKVIVIKKFNADFPELWVSSTHRNYRQVFVKYLAQFFSVNDSLNSCYHVDHILPLSRFGRKYPQYFIRLFLLDKKTNCSFGAGYEKSLNHFESQKELCGGFHLSGMTLLKLFGIKIPTKKSKEDERDNWAKETAKFLEKNGFGTWINIYPILLIGLYDGYRNINLCRRFTLSFGSMQVQKLYDKY